jgi:hypothetical protein
LITWLIVMSDHWGAQAGAQAGARAGAEEQGQGQDPAERLAAALRRIAVGIERREAELAHQPPAPGSTELPVVAANLDALIARLRAVLGDAPPGDHQGGN